MITEEQYKYAASILNCEVATVKAVQKVETGGYGGFLSNQLPVILFEGHIFWKQLVLQKIDPNKFVKGNEDILYKSWTKKYYKGGVEEWTRLKRAIQINREAALKSASWGMFQIMGFNYNSCNCKNIYTFVDKMAESEYQQLLLTINFIKNNKKMLQALQKKSWATFAYYYNGSGYKENKYDTKLEKAYKSFI